jgi:hypothetical protein
MNQTRLILFGIAAVGLAFLPSLRAQQSQSQGQAQQQARPLSDSDMKGMDMGESQHDANQSPQAARAANDDMSDMHMEMSAHMHMTAARPVAPGDAERAEKIVEQLRPAIEKYKDYHVALNDGFKIFFPNVPQPRYHFTNYSNGLAAQFSFDPTKPTSLLYKKVNGEYQLEGAMYTAPKRFSEDQLNERIPLSVAHWHEHVNLCLPPKGVGIGQADLTQFGLRGAIATQDACDAAGGRWMPIIFNWMVHVYPYESDPGKIWVH